MQQAAEGCMAHLEPAVSSPAVAAGTAADLLGGTSDSVAQLGDTFDQWQGGSLAGLRQEGSLGLLEDSSAG